MTADPWCHACDRPPSPDCECKTLLEPVRAPRKRLTPAQLDHARAVDAALHPFGRCTCGCAGTCEWCLNVAAREAEFGDGDCPCGATLRVDELIRGVCSVCERQRASRGES